MAILLAAITAPAAHACATLTPEGQKLQQKRERSWLARHSSKAVEGIFRAQRARTDREDYGLEGYIEEAKGQRVYRYRVTVPGTINCGFPYYYLKDGDKGRFYLDRDGTDPDDRHDGFIDAYDYVHFIPAGEHE